MSRKSKYLAKNIFNKQFGKLTPKRLVKGSETSDGVWECSCACGQTTTTQAKKLVSGHTKSCGCLTKHTLKKGTMYGMLTTIKEVKSLIGSGHNTWLCKCACGKKTKVTVGHLVSGHTQSCGCWLRDRQTTHDMSSTPEYAAWGNMKTRCYNSNYTDYKNYGGRGIKVCDRWLESFQNFYEDMGEKPWPKKLYSIDRINNDGNYEPSNCRWVTKKQQANNRR